MSRLGLFNVGTVGFAIPFPQIEKILQGVPLYRLPRLPGAIVAVLVVDEQLVPLIDIGSLLGGGLESSAERGYQLLLKTDCGMVAIAAESCGRIVAQQKGQIVAQDVKEKTAGITGQFIYQNDNYKILDIDFLAIEMTQVYWQNQPDMGGARRHQ